MNFLRLAKRSAVFWAIGLAIVLLIVGFGYAIEVVLLAFAGVLFAIFLRSIAELLSKAGLNETWSLAASILLVVGFATAAVALLAPRIAEQSHHLRQSIPKSVASFKQTLKEYEWDGTLPADLPDVAEWLRRRPNLFGRITGVVSGTFQAVGVLVVVFFSGLYFAVQTRLYSEGIIRLVKLDRRDRAREILHEIGLALKWWLVGKLIAMAVVGLLTWLGLWFLGVDLALTLATIAALLTFIPNFGPIMLASCGILQADSSRLDKFGVTMRALEVVPGQANSSRVVDRAEPPESEGTVLVETIAIGICGTDREILAGDYGWAPPGEQTLVIGHESLGRVIEAPGDVGVAAGDLVVGIVRRPDPVPCVNCAVGEWDMCRNGQYTECGIKQRHGFCRERFRIEPNFVVKLAPHLAATGMLLEPASILAKAWEHIDYIGRRARWLPKRALLTGAGPVGLLAAMMAKQRGLEVTVFDRVETGLKPDLVTQLGGRYESSDIEQLSGEADVIVECTGYGPLVFQCLQRTRRRERSSA